ncbi:hypothetical protein [Trinickia sp.]|uniref:hypothetical protein n=1 Tax=Trinickia sp. TaxID=2571163 RepID=UPI003F81090D
MDGFVIAASANNVARRFDPIAARALTSIGFPSSDIAPPVSIYRTKQTAFRRMFCLRRNVGVGFFRIEKTYASAAGVDLARRSRFINGAFGIDADLFKIKQLWIATRT